MNTIFIILYLLVAFFQIINIHLILKQLSTSINYCKIPISLLIIYLLSALIYIISEIYSDNNVLRMFLFCTYCTCQIICSVQYNRPHTVKTTIYTTILYSILDSVTVSITYIFLEPLLLTCEKSILMRAISLVFNLVFLTFIKFKPHFNSAINFIYSFNAIPTSIYLLILAALLISGLLLENQLITIGSKGQMFFYIINKYLAAICITLLTIVIVNLLITCITKSYYQNTSSLLEKQINMQLDYYNKLEAKNEELRAFRHDYKNHMLCLQSLIKNNDVESAAEYLQKITNRSYSEAQPYFTGNKIADAILSDKSSAAEKCDTRIIFQGEIFDEIPPADICVILSNALDNAIEASEKISSPDKVIKVSCIFSKNVQIINISNPIDTDTAITDGHIHTSKLDTDNHGFGLYNIKSTVDKYSGDFNINCENGRFVLEIGINVAEYSLNRKIK